MSSHVEITSMVVGAMILSTIVIIAYFMSLVSIKLSYRKFVYWIFCVIKNYYFFKTIKTKRMKDLNAHIFWSKQAKEVKS